jgi:single-stranded-DNA-specific exonuclease
MTLRGVRDAADADRFVARKLAALPDPASMTDMDRATDRVAQACEADETIIVHGDYDVDGVVSTTLLVDFLRRSGVSRVEPSLPHRMHDGYGITAAHIDGFADAGCQLLLTADCGATAHEALERAAERGMDVVVFDHHRLSATLPPAVAVVDPVRDGDDSPHSGLCAAGVAFMALADLRRKLRAAGRFDRRPEPNLKHYLDLVALATIADMVPLTGTNRLLVHHGLGELARRRRPGLAALLEVSDVAVDAPIDASTCGFRLGPRINAAGRLDDPRIALDLLMERDRAAASMLARNLDQLNQRRRQLEELVMSEALTQLERMDDSARGVALLGEGWHKGVLGIVASRVVQRYHRPAAVLAADGDSATGSARSIRGVDLVEALGRGAHMLQRYGGHKAAAGLSLEIDRFDAFQQWFNHEAFQDLPDSAWMPRLEVDAELDVDEVDETLCRQLEPLGPHGKGNPEPRFLARDVPVRAVRQARRGTLQLTVGDRPGIPAVAFGLGIPVADIGRRIDLVYSFGMRRFRGVDSLQIRVHDLCPAGGGGKQ